MGLGFEPQRNHSVLVFLEDSVKSHGCYDTVVSLITCGCIFFRVCMYSTALVLIDDSCHCRIGILEEAGTITLLRSNQNGATTLLSSFFLQLLDGLGNETALLYTDGKFATTLGRNLSFIILI